MVEDSLVLRFVQLPLLGDLSDSEETTDDALSSVRIGTVLMLIAFFLAKENRALLIGEAISKRD